jgi:hypothetical protein
VWWMKLEKCWLTSERRGLQYSCSCNNPLQAACAEAFLPRLTECGDMLESMAPTCACHGGLSICSDIPLLCRYNKTQDELLGGGHPTGLQKQHGPYRLSTPAGTSGVSACSLCFPAPWLAALALTERPMLSCRHDTAGGIVVRPSLDPGSFSQPYAAQDEKDRIVVMCGALSNLGDLSSPGRLSGGSTADATTSAILNMYDRYGCQSKIVTDVPYLVDPCPLLSSDGQHPAAPDVAACFGTQVSISGAAHAL